MHWCARPWTLELTNTFASVCSPNKIQGLAKLVWSARVRLFLTEVLTAQEDQSLAQGLVRKGFHLPGCKPLHAAYTTEQSVRTLLGEAQVKVAKFHLAALMLFFVSLVRV